MTKIRQIVNCFFMCIQTKLEEKLNEAVAMGEFDTADKISNRLAARQVIVHLGLVDKINCV